jgi:hypothetical protein
MACPFYTDDRNYTLFPPYATIMHASLIRRQLSGLVPPKIATPAHLVRRLVRGLSDFF